MESLGRLGDNLDALAPAGVSDKDMSAAFKVAAASLTGLFKVGRQAQQQAYRAGKREALQDVLEFLQASLDHPAASAHLDPSGGTGSQTMSGGGAPLPANVTARLIDYLEARQEALRAEEEDEDESEAARAASAPRPSIFASRQPSGTRLSSLNPSPPPPPLSQQPATPNATPQPAHHLPRAGPHASTSSSAPSSPQHHRSHTPQASHLASTPAASLSASSYPSNASSSASNFTFAASSGPSPVASTSYHPMTAPSTPLFGPTATVHTSGLPSPLTRLQAKREREHHHKERRSTSKGSAAGPSSHPHPHGHGHAHAFASGSSAMGVGVGPAGSGGGGGGGGPTGPEDLSQVVLVGNMKRRWEAVQTAEVELDAELASSGEENGALGEEENDDGGGGAGDEMAMEGMELEERPAKRSKRPGEGGA